MRVFDRSFIPSCSPSEATRRTVGEFGDHLRRSAIPAVPALDDALRSVADECFAGRFEGAIAADTDARIVIDTITASMRIIGDIAMSVQTFDPSYSRELHPIFRESNIRREAHTLATRHGASWLRQALANHKHACRGGNCDAEPTLRAAIVIAMGGH